jgi:hypothetical protein
MELRWLERMDTVVRDDGEECTVPVKVLQYRVMQGPRGEGWWSDWMDVPVESEWGATDTRTRQDAVHGVRAK